MSLATAILLFSIVCHVYSTNTGDQNSCCSSPAGIPGIPGTHGNPGPKGDNGEKGEIGLAGENGEKGDIGRDGAPGKYGPAGQKGDVGQKGDFITGEKGQKGEIGFTGENGEKGDIGRDGAPGPIGQKGDVGHKGDVGQKGTKGTVGLQGSPGSLGRKGEPGPVNTMIFKSAFSVKSAGYKSGEIPYTQPIKYDNVITNIGGDYNLTTAKFVCRVPGAYVFSFTGHNPDNRDLAITIMKNNMRIVSSYSEAQSTSSTSTTVVLELVEGDEVWTRPSDSARDNIYWSSIADASFSGFLLYPTT